MEKKPIKFVFGVMYLPVLIHANICGKYKMSFWYNQIKSPV